MLFIGKSLNQIRNRSGSNLSSMGNNHLSSQLQRLSQLTYPLDSATFARTITDIRAFLSKTVLQKLLPLTKVVEHLQLLRDFFLLRRGEFAMALTQQADDKIRSRWRRADHLAYEKRDGFSQVAVKEGEVAAVLSRTWAALGSMQSQHSDEDAGLELARDLLRLKLIGPNTPSPDVPGLEISPTPFRNLLFGIPVTLTLTIPAPLDLFLTPADLHVYMAINSYLLSIRRAHIRLTDLWKITALRRHHPPPMRPPQSTSPYGIERNRLLRSRQTERGNVMRSAWATASAAIFLLAETEAYLQGEVVAGLTDDFHRWLTGGPNDSSTSTEPENPDEPISTNRGLEDDDGDVWMESPTFNPPAPKSSAIFPTSQPPPHDPQTITTAHRHYLQTLTRFLLLSSPSYTNHLHTFLLAADELTGLVHRLHDVWAAADLEDDVGVVDAFVDLQKEEREVKSALRGAEGKVRGGVEGVVGCLRGLEAGEGRMGGVEGSVVEAGDAGVMGMEEGAYGPCRVGGVDRLLVKLEFGTWVGPGKRRRDESDED